MTYSIGYRTYRGQELWDSFGDHLSEMAAFRQLYQDPTWPVELNPGEVTDHAVDQAQALLNTILQDKALLKAWFGRFATQLDQGAAQQLPEPLSEEETAEFSEFVDALSACEGMEKDPVCRFAYADKVTSDCTPEGQTVLYINGAIWDKQDAADDFIHALCNQPWLAPEQLQDETNHALLYDLWKLQYLVFVE
jgi:50S ribosomal protein L16 3-hydroxylase